MKKKERKKDRRRTKFRPLSPYSFLFLLSLSSFSLFLPLSPFSFLFLLIPSSFSLFLPLPLAPSSHS